MLKNGNKVNVHTSAGILEWYRKSCPWRNDIGEALLIEGLNDALTHVLFTQDADKKSQDVYVFVRITE